MKPISKQLRIGAFVLILAALTSLGIRHVRFGIHPAGSVETPVIAEAEPDSIPAESDEVVTEPDPQYAEVPEPDKQGLSDDYYEGRADSKKDSRAVSEVILSNGQYAKTKGSKGLEKVSLGGNDNLYRTAGGGLWYVSKGPDGKSFKMQVQIDESTGKVIGVGKVYGGKSANSASPEKISISGNEDIYITEEGQAWYVTDDYKAQVEIDGTTGEITVIEQHGDGDGKK